MAFDNAAAIIGQKFLRVETVRIRTEIAVSREMMMEVAFMEL